MKFAQIAMDGLLFRLAQFPFAFHGLGESKHWGGTGDVVSSCLLPLEITDLREYTTKAGLQHNLSTHLVGTTFHHFFPGDFKGEAGRHPNSWYFMQGC